MIAEAGISSPATYSSPPSLLTAICQAVGAVECLMPSAQTCRPEAAWNVLCGHVSDTDPIRGRKLKWDGFIWQIRMKCWFCTSMQPWHFFGPFLYHLLVAFAWVMLETCTHTRTHTHIVSKSRVRIERSPVDWSFCDDEQLGMHHHLTSPWEWEGANDVFDPFKAINLGCSQYFNELNSVLAFFVKSVKQRGENLA